MKRLLRTDAGPEALLLRLTLGVVIFPHGAQKLLGWFGGGGVAGTLGYFDSLGLPPAVAFLVILGEFFGSLGLILGLWTRICAGAIGVIMLGAVGLVHAPHGFFMNWYGDQKGEGFELHLLAIGIALALAVTGGGTASADRKLAER